MAEPFELTWREGCLYLEGRLGDDGRCRAVVSTRVGGVSRGPFASLNMGLSSGDAEENVLRNRLLFRAAAGLPGRQVALRQVHGAQVHCFAGEEEGEERALWRFLGRGDGLATVLAGHTLLIQVADCAPVFLYAPPATGEEGVAPGAGAATGDAAPSGPVSGRAGAKGPALAVAHAGWRGLVGGVLRTALETVTRLGGVRPARVWALVGPHIGPCCYEVDDLVREPLSRVLPRWREAVTGGGPRYRLDLGAAAALLLEEAGLPPGRVAVSSHCTACRRDLFYSYRAEGARTGRLAAAACLVP